MKPDTVLLACSHKNVVPPLTFGKGTNWQPLTFFRRSSTHADQNTTATRTGCHEDVRKGSNRYETRHDQSEVIDPGRHEIRNRDRNDACVALLGDRNGHGDGKPKQPPARRVTRAPHSPYPTFFPDWATGGGLGSRLFSQ